MIPSREHLVEAYAFFVRRANLETRPVIDEPLLARPAAIDAALAMVSTLMADGLGEAPAVLYAFARHPRCFPRAFLAFTALLASQVAQSRGLRLSASSDDYRSIIMSVAVNKASPNEVALWVDSHSMEL